VERAKNRTKSKVRSKVEHVFAVMKLKFGFVKVRLPRDRQEREPAVRHVCAGELIPGPQATAGDNGGVVCPKTAAPLEQGGPLALLRSYTVFEVVTSASSGCKQCLSEVP
jgi:hypothetical protein